MERKKLSFASLHLFKMSEKYMWISAFNSVGICFQDLFSMDDETFENTCKFCEGAGFSKTYDRQLAKCIAESLGVPKQYYDQEPKRIERSNSSQIRYDQDLEYERLEKEQIAFQEEEERKKIEEEYRKKKTYEELIQKAHAVEEEPDNGLRVGFTFKDGKRIIHKFSLETLGEYIKSFIQVKCNMFNSDNSPIEISLKQAFGPELDLKKSLKEQGIMKSIMLTVI